jgi:hypothetical protein
MMVVTAEEVVVAAVAVGEVKMTKFFSHRVQILIYVILVCSFSVQAESSIQWMNEREYRVTISDNNKPILSVVIEYQGKVPSDSEIIDHNWKSIDTDFYRETFNNLSESNIVTTQHP